MVKYLVIILFFITSAISANPIDQLDLRMHRFMEMKEIQRELSKKSQKPYVQPLNIIISQEEINVLFQPYEKFHKTSLIYHPFENPYVRPLNVGISQEEMNVLSEPSIPFKSDEKLHETSLFYDLNDQVSVKGYHRKDGTWVRPHTRKKPHKSR